VAALEAVVHDAAGRGIDHWWALGDLVLFGPRPIETLEALSALPGVEFLSGNTDRYVVRGEQPHPHATAADAAGDPDLVERFGKMAEQIGWTCGALVHAGWLEWLAALPPRLDLTLPDGSSLRGLHANLVGDDGPGIDSRCTDDELASRLDGCDSDIVVGGHTHDPADRVVGRLRALNPGSVGLPRGGPGAAWMIIEAKEDGLTVEHRRAPFDVESVANDLFQRRSAGAPFVASILRGEHPMAH